MPCTKTKNVIPGLWPYCRDPMNRPTFLKSFGMLSDDTVCWKFTSFAGCLSGFSCIGRQSQLKLFPSNGARHARNWQSWGHATSVRFQSTFTLNLFWFVTIFTPNLVVMRYKTSWKKIVILVMLNWYNRTRWCALKYSLSLDFTRHQFAESKY